jgi:endonuclease YncB( thermonuclease family)
MVRILLLGLAGGIAFAGVYTATAPRQAPLVQPALASTDETSSDTRHVRNVTPDILTAPPLMLSPLVRVAPVEEPAEDEPRPARSERLALPVIETVGLLRAGTKTVRFAGINAPAADAVCGAEKTWPCGRMAKAALQRFLRGRSVECAVSPDNAPAEAATQPEETDCAVGGVDIARWLVAEGWAKPSGRFEAEGEMARRAGKGLWSETRPDISADAQTAQAAPASSPDRAMDMSLRVSGMP